MKINQDKFKRDVENEITSKLLYAVEFTSKNGNFINPTNLSSLRIVMQDISKWCVENADKYLED